MARPKLVLFDLDGTLLDGAGLPGAMRRTAAALAARTADTDADRIVAANTEAWQRLWPEVEDEYLLGGRSGDEVQRDAWAATLAGAGTDPALLDTALVLWRAEEEAIFRLFDDVLPALDAIAATGIRIGLLTNGAGTVQRRKLAVTGIADRFDPLVISGEVGVRKPDEDVFGVALHLAGVPAGRAWYVGDNLWHDVAPAHASGLHAVWVDRHGVAVRPEWPQPDAVVDSLAALPGLLAEAAEADPDQDPR